MRNVCSISPLRYRRWMTALHRDSCSFWKIQRTCCGRKRPRRGTRLPENCPRNQKSIDTYRFVRRAHRPAVGQGCRTRKRSNIAGMLEHYFFRSADCQDAGGRIFSFRAIARREPAPADLNEVVENALSVFAGRLDDIEVRKSLATGLPMVNIDREQFKRIVVNLVDNAAEAMRDSLIKQLYVGTAAIGGDFVELTIADTGCGISHEDKEKLFLPYFTRNPRGTGLGLAIVNHIVSEHGAQIRVENNHPKGARFVIEVGAMVSDTQPIETNA